MRPTVVTEVRDRVRAGVVGSPIAHSLSPVLHTAAWTVDFARAEVHRGELAQYVASLDNTWVGLAVTMPLKHEALQLAQMNDGLASAVGAVNTLVFQPTGSSRLIIGFNTDVAGIVQAIRASTATQAGVAQESAEVRRFDRALILGSGATASSALAAALELGANQVTVAARRMAGPNTVFTAAHRLHVDVAYTPLTSLREAVARADLVISTLPFGVADGLLEQFGDVSECRDVFAGKVLLDVVYHPYPSAFVSFWQRGGGTVVPGWEMLLYQAAAQVQLFSSRAPDVALMRKALLEELVQRS